MTTSPANHPPRDSVAGMVHPAGARLRNAVPLAAAATPTALFLASGTTIPLGPLAEDLLTAGGWATLVVTAVAIGLGTRLSRAVAASAQVLWWSGIAFEVSAVTRDNATVSAFGASTMWAIPILIAFLAGRTVDPEDIAAAHDDACEALR